MRAWNVVWCGSFNNPVLSFPDISTKYEKAENGLEASYETASVCQRTTILPWIINSWFWNLHANCKNIGIFLGEKKVVLPILECIIHCHPLYHLFFSIAGVYLMNSECLIFSLPSFTHGTLAFLWMSSDHNWNQHPYWAAGKDRKGKHCWIWSLHWGLG